MMNEGIDLSGAMSAGVEAQGGFIEIVQAPILTYQWEARDKDGLVKWKHKQKNLVVNQGRTNVLEQYFRGAAYTAAWFMGLVDNASFTAIAAADTMASHAGWLESSAYSNANRPSVAFSAAAANSMSTSTGCVFNINATVTVNGAFVTTANNKGGTTGLLYSASSLSPTRSLVNGDTLTINLTLNA